MTITVVQTATNSGPPPFSFASNVTAGNTVVLVATAYATGGANVTASGATLGGSAPPGTVAFFNPGTTGGVNSASSGGDIAFVAIWILPDCPGGSQQVTIDVDGGNNNIGQVAYEVSGLGPIPLLDKSSSGTSISASTIDSGSTGAITAAPEFIAGGSMHFGGAGPGAPSGFTAVNPAADLWAGYQIAVSSGGSYDWQQTSSGTPWAAALVTLNASPIPAPFYPVTYARAKLPVPFLKGRTSSNPGAPVQNPGVVPVYGAVPGAIRASLPVNLRGRTSSGPGGPVRNPPAAPVAQHGPAGNRNRLPLRGRIVSCPGGPVSNPPPVPAPFFPFRSPARIRPSLPPRGRAASCPGGPVRNPGTGPLFTQAVTPARARIPQNGPRGRAACCPGGPVSDINRIRVTLGLPYTRWKASQPY